MLSVIALAVALTGSAYASGTAGPGAIATNAVRSRQIDGDAVKGRHIRPVPAAKLYGGGVLGGEVEGFSLPLNQSGDNSAAPIGSGDSPNYQPVPMPSRTVIRDLYVNAESPPVRRIRFRLRGSQNEFLACTIPIGKRRCHNTKGKMVLQPGDYLDVFIGDLGPASIPLPANDYRFSYRAVS